ncbi:hypothetical protein Tco_0996211 [Tanacetum coccineum]
MVDMIPNGVFRAELDVDSIIDKMREGRLRWFGHVKRKPQTVPVKRVEAMLVEGLRRRGIPKLRSEDRLKQDMKELLLSEDMTSDRNAWRDRTKISGSLCLLGIHLVFVCVSLVAFVPLCVLLVFMSLVCLYARLVAFSPGRLCADLVLFACLVFVCFPRVYDVACLFAYALFSFFILEQHPYAHVHWPEVFWKQSLYFRVYLGGRGRICLHFTSLIPRFDGIGYVVVVVL